MILLLVAALLADPLCPPGCLDPDAAPRICWDAVGDEDLAGYVVRNEHGDEQMTAGVETCMALTGSPLIARNESVELVVRAVDSAGLRSIEPSNAVPVRPWACLRSVNCRWEPDRRGRPQWLCDGCEEPCYPGARYRAPWVARCG